MSVVSEIWRKSFSPSKDCFQIFAAALMRWAEANGIAPESSVGTHAEVSPLETRNVRIGNQTAKENCGFLQSIVDVHEEIMRDVGSSLTWLRDLSEAQSLHNLHMKAGGMEFQYYQ